MTGLFIACQSAFPADPSVNESKRQIPVAFDVDVVVVGGTTRGVAAAIAAADEGATVFLAARKHYLGRDMCATGRLWLEEGEVPETELAKSLFSPPPVGIPSKQLPFSYTLSAEASAPHPDPDHTALKDGAYADPVNDSILFYDDVTITADLGSVQEIDSITLHAFEETGEYGFKSARFLISTDGKAWRPVTTQTRKNDKTENTESGVSVLMKGRYVKLEITRHPDCRRMLLGELVITKPDRGEMNPVSSVTSPMQVKVILDKALLDAGVHFLYGSYPADLLYNKKGQIAGITMVNRSGRQAVLARTIIDATDRGVLARMTEAEFSPYPSGKYPFKRIVIGGEPRPEATELAFTTSMNADKTASSGKPKDQILEFKTFEYTMELPMKDGSWASFARADKLARNQSWQPGQAAASEELFQVPPDPVKGQATQTTWNGADDFNLAAMKPVGVEHLFLLGPCADTSREVAAQIMRPLSGLALGSRVGKAAAKEAATIRESSLNQISVRGLPAAETSVGEVYEVLKGLRSFPDPDQETISSDERMLPVLGRYDLVVVGGGTAGAPAAISASRAGARTLVLETLHGLGGVGTLGRISSYWFGNRVGFTAEVDEAIGTQNRWNIEKKMEWLRSELVKAGGDVWYGTLGAGAVVDGKRVIGIVVATPNGRGVVLANTVIDSTGNAVIPACIGAETQAIGGEHISIQGSGLPPMTPDQSYMNSDWTFVDDDDVIDMWRTFLVGKTKYSGSYDMGQLLDTRARRRIVGEIIISPMDIYNQRTFPDTITQAMSNFDNHGFSSHSLFMLVPPDHGKLWCNVPYRALIPKGWDGLLVTGLGISAHGDAMPVVRMQPDVQNQGYAAGRAAAMAARDHTTIRGIDIKELQQHLVDKGILDESVLRDTDSYPMPEAVVAEAVAKLDTGYDGIPVIMASVDTALPFLRAGYESAPDEDARLRYAQVLGMLHDDTGSPSLIRAIAASGWDEGWRFRGMGQFGSTTSPLDNLIIALSRTGDMNGLEVIIDKLEALTPESELSHCRAIAKALENYGSRKGARPLAKFLMQEGVRGHAFVSIDETLQRTPININDVTTRDNALREIILARALYRCGDYKNTGKSILEEFTHDLRGHFSRHAKAILAE